MATAKAKSGTARKSPAGKKAAAKKSGSGLDLNKYLDDIKIGSFGLDDVMDGTNKNIEAIANANRALIDGYTDIAKRQYEMLKELLEDLKKVGGNRSDIVAELKKVVEQARKDLQVLQKMANKTNSQAQRIVKKRTDATVKALKKLVDETKKSVSKAAPATKKAPAKKKAAPKKKKAAPKRKAAPRKTAAAAAKAE